MILVFGKTGQVGTELAALPDTLCLGRDDVDFTDVEAAVAAIHHHLPDAVINAAAYTNVDAAEEGGNETLAMMINAATPTTIAMACTHLKIPLVHISTDYVMDGTGTAPWPPDAPTAPLGAYGRSKLKGEEYMRKYQGTLVILRTSWVVSAHNQNFVKTMLRLGTERDQLTIVNDQIGGPTPARAIAAACHDIALQLIDAPEKAGTYHFSGAPDCSWADFAREIFDQAGINCDVVDISSEAYARENPGKAERPLNSRLDCTTLTDTFGIERPDWRVGLTDILKDLDQII